MAENQGKIIQEYLQNLEGGINGFADDEGKRSFLYRQFKKQFVSEELKKYLESKGHKFEKIINEYRATKMQQFVPTSGDNEYFKSQYNEINEQ